MKKTKIKNEKLLWKCHTPNLVKEIINNNASMWMMHRPLQILTMYLELIAAIAADIGNDDIKAICVMLTLYEGSDPESKEFDPKMTEWARKTLSKRVKNLSRPITKKANKTKDGRL